MKKKIETEEEINELEKNLKDNVVWKPMKSPVKRFNYFAKDKAGKELSFREFMSRWKQGIEGITPIQQVKGQLNSTYIMLIGIFCGFVITMFAFKTLWWLTIILGGALFNTGVSALGLWQKKRIFKKMEEMVDVK